MRHSMRLAACIVGMWLGGLLVVGLAIPTGFRAVDTILKDPGPEAGKLIEKLGPADARILMRHAVATGNRQFFYLWGFTQVVLAGILLTYLVFGTSTGRVSLTLAGVMFLLAVWMMLWLIPEVDTLSRALEFDQSVANGPTGVTFRALHRMFGAAEGAMAVLALVLLVRFLRHTRIQLTHHRSGV